MISLEEINRLTLRQFKDFFETELRRLGVSLPIPWEPSDEELERIARAYGEAMEVYEDGA